MTMRRSSNIAKDGIQEPGSSSFEKTFIAERLAKHELPEFPANVFKNLVGTLVEALKLADAPDLGFRNHRFQNVPFRFKK